MPNRYGPRAVFAIFVPLQNANMQPEYDAMKVDGVSHQIYRFTLDPADRVPESILKVVDGALGCWPDRIIIGNNVEMRVWTPDQHEDYVAALQENVGDVPVVTATHACIAALRTLGAKRIGALSPMSDRYSKSVNDFYAGHGFDVRRNIGLQVGLPENIINIGYDEALAGFREIDGDDIDTFLHVGAALGITDRIEDLERALGRPVVSANVAAYWYALRLHGITDPLPGYGRLAQIEQIAA